MESDSIYGDFQPSKFILLCREKYAKMVQLLLPFGELPLDALAVESESHSIDKKQHMTRERLIVLKSVAEAAQRLHHSPTLMAAMLMEALLWIEHLQTENDELRKPDVSQPERD